MALIPDKWELVQLSGFDCISRDAASLWPAHMAWEREPVQEYSLCLYITSNLILLASES